ncbi:MAG: Holliday junction branch migration DNA helicase RuvB [Spirochaetia bacterium]|nr:Holliday junction branch migration DNA helicase RuvB [Spirochaetia bacterium]MBQ3648282.1 Holliday junction branch migration DNA helicase RuvB [Spirochaetia bacterium]MBQ3713451.1 Holliday junction branch migration DNA helicase RuvB [Spirochaetia bacterium]MBQ6673957.1 Holliday junction branch migration DNA helicase RuvB [Spirochaetia bacterium]MBR0318798.1 Holliday junction branch migration DNA helicase RuvB [Spirochaetia bacterium]
MIETENNDILSGEIIAEDKKDYALRPQTLDDFQGQKALKENLKIFLKAAKARGESLDHVFLSGPPGLGKTTLAGIIAHEMNAEFKVTSAPALDKPKDLAGLLTTISPNTVFFIDEIHRLKPAIEEMLYVAMEDFELDWVIGQGPSARSIRLPIPPFTLVGATTKSGNVSSPLFSRFGINIRMNLYEKDEITDILKRSSAILEIKIEKSAMDILATCCRGTPRVANRILRRMRDFAQIYGDDVITTETVRFGLEKLEIDEMGLEAHDRELLRAIIEKYGGGPVGADTLAITIGESTETLEDFYEPYLIQQGFIQRTPRGRVATPAAYRHLGLEAQLNEDQRLFL